MTSNGATPCPFCCSSGGSTFIAGSVCYYPQFNTPEFDGYYWGAVLYTLGSCGFFLVDVQVRD